MTPLTSTCRLAKAGAVIAGAKARSSGRISGDRMGIGANLARPWFRNCPLSEVLLPSYLPSKRPKSRREDVKREEVERRNPPRGEWELSLDDRVPAHCSCPPAGLPLSLGSG